MEKKTSVTSVLIVDGNARIRRALSFILTSRGYDVATARDGVEAIARIKERPFDLTFMDSRMFTVKGVDAYKKIKQMRPEAEVVVITSPNEARSWLKQTMSENAWGPLFKPFSAEKVFTIIEESTRIKAASLTTVFDREPEVAPAF